MSETQSNEALEVGKRLVELCSAGKSMQALDELYADNIVSTEACGSPEMPARMEGIDAIRGKHEWWFANHEVHGESCEGPYPHGDQFAAVFWMDITSKVGPMAGKRMQMKEVALYTVAGGKIVEEKFFYDMGGCGE